MPLESYRRNGKLKVRNNYKDGEVDGKLEEFLPNGRLFRKVYFKNGEEISPNYFYSNGKLIAQGFFKNDKRDGLWKFFRSNGKLKSKKTYRNGEVISSEKF